ncbi:DUF4344 domain-containing metallopeptidase [Zavarzinia aquatilis]|uniref:Metallopeptidase n=1 Tax=Zavarzinia aquatilis TaxID=2211142 RepID=A0A317E7G2_9PROT|nr:DUF4344 domain-containing metallopeptidase [Zavarzinia aquatilis]PWR21343.1 hypothetical protein DKG74_12935 [Zavarzinia aquatilis]
MIRRLCLLFLLLLGAAPAAAEPRPLDAGDRLFIQANVQWTVGHEIGHALIDQLQLPVFGREEDAADMLGALLLVLRRDAGLQPDFRERLKAIADGWLLEWLDDLKLDSSIPYWDQHSLDIQRLFTFTCLIFGSDPEHLRDLADTATLPVERALYCPDEYALAARSIDWVSQHYGRPAGEMPAPGAGRFRVTYETGGASRVRDLIEIVQADPFVQEAADRLSERLRLPRDIGIVFTDCGNPDAFYNANTVEIVICYGLLEHFADYARRRHDPAPGRSLCDVPVTGMPAGRRYGCSAPAPPAP